MFEQDFVPGYLKLHKTGELKQRGKILWEKMEKCDLCPRLCGANRLEGERGICGADLELEISSAHPHFGEEKPLVGDGGSGTVFLTHCNLKCVFCINWDISHGGEGRRSSIDEFADIMLELQKTGCSNINIVTPSHYSPHIFLALDLAASKGLTLPLVYNTCGWETTAVLGLLDGIVDIYLADFKYFNNKNASRYSLGAESYPEITQKALEEMNRQVGVAKPAADNLMKKGLMVRHLVMPDDVSGSKKVVDWMAKNLPKDTYLNLMSQYSPYYKAMDYPHISRKITRKEYVEVIQHAKEVGLTNLEIQGYFN